jgi:hypothetical protein
LKNAHHKELSKVFQDILPAIIVIQESISKQLSVAVGAKKASVCEYDCIVHCKVKNVQDVSFQFLNCAWSELTKFTVSSVIQFQTSSIAEKVLA